MPYKHIIVLVAYMLIAAAVNVTKPVHLDDAGYLEIARAILRAPLRPLSQDLNWGDSAAPIFDENQPLLVPYIFASLIAVFGESELILHLFIACCSALAIYFFYRLTLLFEIRRPLFLTGLFALGPSFLPGQNLMVDMPLMACWLVFFWAIFSTENAHRHRYTLAGLAVSCACLTKYTGLVLFPIFAFALLYRRHWKHTWQLGIPVIAMLLWSWFNYLDFGSIHLFSRPTPTFAMEKTIERLVTFTAGIGSVSPFVLSFMLSTPSAPTDRVMLLAALATGIAPAALMLRQGQTQFAIYWLVFFVAGVVMVGFVLMALCRHILLTWKAPDVAAAGRDMVLALWITGTAAFIVLFSPFIAIRHVFLIIPALLLVLGRHLTERRDVIAGNVASFVLTSTLGLALAVSDYSAAEVYRAAAYKIRNDLPPAARVYQTGHWGWQWYAMDAGMIQYDMMTTDIRHGDYLVVPSHIHRQHIAPEHDATLREAWRLAVPAPVPTYLRTVYSDIGGGYYLSEFATIPPWRLSRAPFEFVVFQSVQ